MKNNFTTAQSMLSLSMSEVSDVKDVPYTDVILKVGKYKRVLEMDCSKFYQEQLKESNSQSDKNGK